MKDKDKFTSKIDDLIRELAGSSNSKDRELAKKAIEMQSNQKKFEKSLSDLQDSLDYLRISIKYTVFDLEATRRENTYLRKLLEGEFDDEEYTG